MPATRFRGPVRTGTPDRGATSLNTLDTLPAVRRRSVSADGVYAVGPIPAGDIIRMWINTETAWEGSAGCTTTLRVGTSGDNTFFGSIVLSAVAMREVTMSGASLLGLASGQQIIADLTTVGTAGVGLGSFYLEYLQAE